MLRRLFAMHRRAVRSVGTGAEAGLVRLECIGGVDHLHRADPVGPVDRPAGVPPCRPLAASIAAILAAVLSVTTPSVRAGNQQYEPLSAAVRSALTAAVAADGAPEARFASQEHKLEWLIEVSGRLPRRHKPTYTERVEFLQLARYEAQRAGLDPHLVLGLIEVESNFRRFAISGAGARGYMQVMPFWAKLIGDGDASRLFDARTNLRFGCVILRHYLDIERGDLFRALGRYNGSLGRAEYPNLVLRAWRKWEAYGKGELLRQASADGAAGTSGASARPGGAVASAGVEGARTIPVAAPGGVGAAAGIVPAGLQRSRLQ